MMEALRSEPKMSPSPRCHQITGFHYLARQDNGWNGAFAKTDFFVGEKMDKFSETPAATATFGKVREAQTADLAQPVTGRFIKVRVLSEVNGKSLGSAAEIGAIGKASE